MPTNLRDVEIEEISILGKASRPAVRAARIAIFKRAEGLDQLAHLQGRVQTIRQKIDAAVLKFDQSQPRDEHGRWSESGGGGGADSSGADTGGGGGSAANWAGRIANVAAIAALAIPGFAGLRAAKIVFDSTRQLLSNLKFLAAPSTLGRTTATETARFIATTPEARKKVVQEVVTAMAEKNNVAWSTAAGALSIVFGFLADMREAEISKADKRDPILEQLRSIQDALAALNTDDDTEIEKELTNMDLEHHAREIRKRDGCSGTEALRKARTEYPDAYDSYTAAPVRKSALDFDALVEQEIRKGSPPSVAGQRVLLKYGVRPPKEPVE